MRLPAHKTEAVYRRYAIVSKRDLREAVQRLAVRTRDHWSHSPKSAPTYPTGPSRVGHRLCRAAGSRIGLLRFGDV